MAGEIGVTLVGNLSADPELMVTPSGKTVVNFTIASTPRTFDKASNDWVDGTTTFMPCSLWGAYAENVAASLGKGMEVIAQGVLETHKWEKDGQEFSRIKMRVEAMGPTLKFATAQVIRKPKAGAAMQDVTPASRPTAPEPQAAARPPDDPWSPASIEPPF